MTVNLGDIHPIVLSDSKRGSGRQIEPHFLGPRGSLAKFLWKIGSFCIPATAAFPTPATHTLYLRPHAPKIPTETDSHSLFIVNVPVDSTAAHFRAIFYSLVGPGRFESITFAHQKSKTEPSPQSAELAPRKGNKRKRSETAEVETELPQIWDRQLVTSGGAAVALLVDDKSLEMVLKAVRSLHKSSKASKWPIWGEGVADKVPAIGMARYLSHQQLKYPDETALGAMVDAFMKSWNNTEEEQARLAKRKRNVPDENGFVTVTRGGRTGPARQEDAEEKRRELEEKERKKRDEMGNFYRFQTRERRKAEQSELVKRFEEDKKRVESMKEKRGRFRPER
ncbi:ribosomal RNA-processing protein 7-domain-containing protein [Calycina marina]|uniref:Ribosomal RNA-processing protein 7-domain-containing protein n=1 Tax=Calycina marina TaxID=1763456 RepID=A0A9P8CH75_9HELO|nr:ribosomal RNA-processing protein 7-domain-containing protein [Calycina marina]